MSNLGGYQTIVTLMKRLGGPKKFTIISVSTIATLTLAARKLVADLFEKLKSYNKKDLTELPIYEFTVTDLESSEVQITAGMKFRVLVSDSDMILIEIIDDPNSPYCVSPEWLITVSNYKGGVENG